MKAEAAGRRTPLIVFVGRYKIPPSLKRKLHMLAAQIVKEERKNLKADLIFIGDTQMKKLNRRFRGKDKTTDVLSFPIEANGKNLEGEIYISFAQAKRQASFFGNKIEGEILRLCTHGLLHLLGYDHQTVKARNEMFTREEKYLKGFEASSSRGRKC